MAVRENPETAQTKFAKSAGFGTAYFFVRGSGTVVARERNVASRGGRWRAQRGCALRTGAVLRQRRARRDGPARREAFPDSQHFNEFAAELNTLVERTSCPLLREKGNVGVTVHFVGCAEVPETAADVGEPL